MTIMTDPDEDTVESNVSEKDRCNGGCSRNNDGNGSKLSDHMEDSNWMDDPGDEGDVESTGSMDEQESFQKRFDLTEELKILENEFNELKTSLFSERLQNIQEKQREVSKRTAVEYSIPVLQINENVRIRHQIIELKAELTRKLAEYGLECENQIADNDYEESRRRAKEDMKASIARHRRRLEERYNESRVNNLLDLSNGASALTGGGSGRRRRRHVCDPYAMERRKRPQTISGPYIVYSLRDDEVKEDWAKIIRLRPRSTTGLLTSNSSVIDQTEVGRGGEQHQPGPYSARYDNGRLLYEDECFTRNDYVRLDERSADGDHIHSMRCRIVAVHSNGILIRNESGARSKVGLNNLQIGRFKLTHIER